MGIVNNISSNMILGELHKNTKKKDKASGQLALGEKIRNAGDDASGLAISEKMRVRIRALGQDEANVKNGASMLRTAEGAIQSQINLLRTIKEKVIDAHNDTNTDTDRAIIQKEITNYYEEINDIAAETTFNKKLLLLGNTVQETVKSWVVMDHAELVEGSDELNLIPDTQGDLDGEPGPFATFGSASDQVPYDGYNTKAVAPSAIPGFDNTVTPTSNAYYTTSKLHDGTENTPNTIEINLVGNTDTSLDNTSFTVTSPYYSNTYVLTKDTSKHYQNNSESNEINISGMSADQIASAIASRISGDFANYYNASAAGGVVTLKTKAPDGDTYNTPYYFNRDGYYNVKGIDLAGGASGVNRTEAPATGLGNFNLSGGADEQGHNEPYVDPATDETKTKYVKDKDAVNATVTKSLSGVPANSGITLKGYNRYGTSYSTAYLVFLDDDSDFVPNSNGYYTVGKNGTHSITMANMNIKITGGNLVLTAYYPGSAGNSDGVTDGVPKATATENYYTATTMLPGIDNKHSAKSGDWAHWDWDLSGYNVSDESKAEDLIEKLVGKAFYHDSRSGYTLEFVDSSKSPSLDSINKLDGSTMVDLNKVRDDVQSGTTVSEAFANLLSSIYPSYFRATNPDYDSSKAVSETNKQYIQTFEPKKNDAGDTVGVKINATVPGTNGNDQYLVFREGGLRSYTIDFADFFNSNGIADGNIASTLDGKGIRFYCATDSSQWVNVQFVNGVSPEDDDRPASGTASLDIKTFVVDVSDVTDVKSLVKTIYEGDGNKNPQGLEDWLTNTYNHFFHLAADYDNGSVTIYDNRRFTLLNRSSYQDKQEKGAKIADGVMDNVKQDKRYVYVNDLVIHHTDRSSANIHVRIPQTTMDHIFGYKVGTYTLDDYSVMTSEKREKLLGTDGPPKVEGTLDKGLQYLIDANTLIGAQIVHMEFAEANIITDQESTMSAESVIRDADMAKSSLELATAQILAQSGQTMLSQSNQNSSNVLSLLQ